MSWIRVYFAMVTLSVLTWYGVGGYMYLEENHAGIYCDFTVPADEANFVNYQGKHCRIRFDTFASEFGPQFLIVLGLAHLPGYFYLAPRRRWRRRRDMSEQLG